MSHFLSIQKHLFARGRHLTTMGQSEPAREALGQLLEMPDVSRKAKATTHALLGNLEFAARRFRRARKQFAIAFELNPNEPRYYLDYAEAVLADVDANPSNAYRACRRAVQIDPTEPRYWIAFGKSAVRIGKRQIALKAFRQAERRQAQEFDALAGLVHGYLSLGRLSDARSVLTTIRFQFPRDGRVASLRNHFRFECARQAQRKNTGRDANATILGFMPKQSASQPATGSKIIRVDRRSLLRPNVLRMLGFGGKPSQM